VSRPVLFEVHPTEPLRLVATLANGSRCEIEVRFAVISVTDHEALVRDSSNNLVPSVGVSMLPVVVVRGEGAAPAPPPGVISTGNMPN
jgi:hypothetical protein